MILLEDGTEFDLTVLDAASKEEGEVTSEATKTETKEATDDKDDTKAASSEEKDESAATEMEPGAEQVSEEKEKEEEDTIKKEVSSPPPPPPSQEEEGPKPRPLHLTKSLYIRTVAPNIKRSEIVEVGEEF